MKAPPEDEARRFAALEQSNAALESSARKAWAAKAVLDDLLDSASDLIVSIDPAGMIFYANHAFRMAVGIGPSEGALSGSSLLRLLAPEHRDQVVAILERLARGEQVTRFETALITKEGGQIDLEGSLAVRFEAGSAAIGGVFRDITARKRTDEGRKAVERMKDEFISTVSHELRTPLTSIRGALGLLEGGVLGALPEEAMEVVQIARTSTDRLIRLINDILDLEKIESGKMELKTKAIDVGHLIASTFEGLRNAASTAGVDLEVDVRAHFTLIGDEDRLTQVLTNLASNAAKFSPLGGKVTVRVSTASPGRVRFSVEDHGAGIAEKDLQKLFGKFQQLDSRDNRQQGGTGLGLAISKAIVEQHGGTIGVESRIGEGSTFWFDLPAEAMPMPEPSKASMVLVVESDSTLARTLTRLLQGEGHRVVYAATLADAMHLIDAERPAAVIVDAGLPDGNGLELLSRLGAREEPQRVPVLVLAACEPEEGTFRTPLLVDWLIKPLDAVRLVASLRWALHKKSSARVLVVEDDPEFREVLVRQLSALGTECVPAVNGEQAVQFARMAQPDLIILDIGLPGRDGFDVVATLRDEVARDTPLIVYTGRDLTSVDQDALRLGITRYVTKSRTSESEFVGHVRELLAGLNEAKALRERPPPGSSLADPGSL